MSIYPTWTRFTKLWKTVIYPVIRQNVNIEYFDKPTTDEEYEIATKDTIDDAKIANLVDKIKSALLAKDYNVVTAGEITNPYDGIWEDEDDEDDYEDDYDSDYDLIIQGKDRYAPEIDISLFTSELDNDEILYGWDDSRFAENWKDPQDDFGFNLNYSKWIKDHNIIDNYDNILKAPKEVQKSYCDWVRSTDFTRLWVRIIYAE